MPRFPRHSENIRDFGGFDFAVYSRFQGLPFYIYDEYTVSGVEDDAFLGVFEAGGCGVLVPELGGLAVDFYR